MKHTETLFQSKGTSDKKNILNRHTKNVPVAYLNQIENGITLEELDTMSANGLPIFKYHTQITIHGIFDDLNNNSIHGYVNLFQNKNRSIGIKYNAIDEGKRKRIAKRLSCIGFNYNRNSTSCVFSKSVRVDKDTIQQAKKEYLTLAEKFDKSLFYGGVYMWIGSVFGQMYLILDITINAIYETNIEPLLNKVGATVEILEAKEAKEQKEDAQRQARWDKEKAEKQARREVEKLKHIDNLTHLKNTYEVVSKVQETGTYLKPEFNYSDELQYTVTHVYDVKGKKLPRWNKNSFDTMREALEYIPSESQYMDSIFKGTVTGYKLN